MAFDASNSTVLAAVSGEEPFARRDRFVVLAGAAALGAAFGFAMAMFGGRWELWLVALATFPVFALALHLTGHTLTEALRERAYGCATAAALHVAAMLAWPITTLFTPMAASIFWIAPSLALTALFLLTSCWRGAPRAVYRAGLQGALVAALAAHHGVFVVMGA